ncbi:MAG: hypothetical protein EA370_01605 [Wenzhouxiangella sp.]|nr:MAG: hypothetical protein EA370_01605 [Wenzhouxiangella sp.]
MNKTVIILVFVVFGAPVLIATLLHSEWFDARLGGTRNHGEFVHPVIPLPDGWSIQGAPGAVLEREDLLDRWHLVHLRQTVCDEDCLEDLYWLRQIRRAQDRHQPDVGLLLVSLVAVDEETRDQITALADDFLIADGDAARTLHAAFPGDPESPSRYILDPMANIIMVYADDADPNGIRRDLRRLLTWTQRN